MPRGAADQTYDGERSRPVPILLERGFSPRHVATLAGLIWAMQVPGRVDDALAGRVSVRSLSVVVPAI